MNKTKIGYTDHDIGKRLRPIPYLKDSYVLAILHLSIYSFVSILDASLYPELSNKYRM